MASFRIRFFSFPLYHFVSAKIFLAGDLASESFELLVFTHGFHVAAIRVPLSLSLVLLLLRAGVHSPTGPRLCFVFDGLKLP